MEFCPWGRLILYQSTFSSFDTSFAVGVGALLGDPGRVEGREGFGAEGAGDLQGHGTIEFLV